MTDRFIYYITVSQSSITTARIKASAHFSDVQGFKRALGEEGGGGGGGGL
jgi:hypothetical protein